MTTSSQARVDRACAFADRLDRMAAWLERHRLRRRAITVRWVAAMLRGRIAQVALNTIPPGGELHFPAGIYAMRGTLKLPHIPADGPKSVVTFGPGSVMIPVEGEASQTASWVRDQP